MAANPGTDDLSTPARIETRIVGVLYVLLFGLGSVVGIGLMSAGCWLQPAGITVGIDRAVRVAAGPASIALGHATAVAIGFADGLLPAY